MSLWNMVGNWEMGHLNLLSTISWRRFDGACSGANAYKYVTMRFRYIKIIELMWRTRLSRITRPNFFRSVGSARWEIVRWAVGYRVGRAQQGRFFRIGLTFY